MKKCYFKKYQNIAKALYLKSLKQRKKVDQAFNEFNNRSSNDQELTSVLLQNYIQENKKLEELDKKLHTIWKKTGCIARTELHYLGMI